MSTASWSGWYATLLNLERGRATVADRPMRLDRGTSPLSGQLMSTAFAADLEDLVMQSNQSFHGHVHDSWITSSAMQG